MMSLHAGSAPEWNLGCEKKMQNEFPNLKFSLFKICSDVVARHSGRACAAPGDSYPSRKAPHDALRRIVDLNF